MRLFVLFIAIAMLAGCGVARRMEIADHREDYQQCLRRNKGDDSQCVTEKKIYEADYPKGPPKEATVCTQLGNSMVCN